MKETVWGLLSNWQISFRLLCPALFSQLAKGTLCCPNHVTQIVSWCQFSNSVWKQICYYRMPCLALWGRTLKVDTPKFSTTSIFITTPSIETGLQKYWFQLSFKMIEGNILFFQAIYYMIVCPYWKGLLIYRCGTNWDMEVITASGIIFMYMITIFNIHVIPFYKNIILL